MRLDEKAASTAVTTWSSKESGMASVVLFAALCSPLIGGFAPPRLLLSVTPPSTVFTVNLSAAFRESVTFGDCSSRLLCLWFLFVF